MNDAQGALPLEPRPAGGPGRGRQDDFWKLETLSATTLKQCFAAKHSLEADDRAKDATPDEEASGIARDAQRNKATQKRESGGQYRARKWTNSGCRNC